MMLQWSLLALMAIAGVRGDGYQYSAAAPVAVAEAAPAPYPAAAAAPAPYPAAAPEAAALTDGTTYIQYPGQYTYSEPGFSVQTGYEGYLVPAAYPAPTGHSGLSSFLGLLTSIPGLPKLALKLLPKAVFFFLPFIGLLLIGGAFTTAVCALTPICTISFLGFGLRSNTMRSYLTPDRLTQTTAFVLDAIDKYREISNKVAAKEKADKRRK